MEGINRSTVKDRIDNWVKQNSEPPVSLELEDYNEYHGKCIELETQLLDSAKQQNKGKPHKYGKKEWMLEYRWQSEEHYKIYAWSKMFNPFTTKWHSKGRYRRLRDAMNFARTLRPDPHQWRDDFTGRDFRIRNTKTREVYKLENE